jgi:hypothetical protein
MRSSLMRIVCGLALVVGGCDDSDDGGGGAGGSSAQGGRGGSGSGGSGSGGSGTGGSGTGGTSGSGGTGTGTGGTSGSAGSGSGGATGDAGTGGTGGGASDASGETGSADGASGETGGAAPGVTFEGTHPSCPACRSIFNGKDLTGWTPIGAEKWEAVENTILSTGASSGALVTVGDYDHYRLFFSWKMLSGGHAANMLVLCRDRTKRNCAGIQFQNPGSDIWDYGPANARVPRDKGMLIGGRASVPQGQSGMCEMIVKHSAGTFKVACCNLGAAKTCKTVPSAVLNFGSAFPKGPLGFQAHNANHKIHWWDVFIEENPTSDEYLSK